MMENQKKETNRTNEIGAETFGLEISRPNADAIKDVPSLNCENAYRSFSPEDQEKMSSLANSIELTKHDQIMNYGATPFTQTVTQCSELLKRERGSDAEQRVISEIVEISKNIMQESDEFNGMIKEPKGIQKVFMKMFYGNKTKCAKLSQTVLTIYDMIGNLQASYSRWIENLKDANEEIEYAAISDITAIKTLEKYIIAGKIAETRLKEELEKEKAKQEETGMFSLQYNQMKEGYERFCRRMGVLEDARVFYHVSIAELMLMSKSNKNAQETINNQAQVTMAFLEIQLRNAMLNEKIKEVIEGHKAITKLSGEVVKRVAKNICTTVEATEKLLGQAIIDPNITKEAIETVLKTCETINNISKGREAQLENKRKTNDALIQKLQPFVTLATNVSEIENTVTPSAIEEELKF